MKKASIIISSALTLLVLAFAACEKEEEATPSPTPVVIKNPLIGTTWVSCYDTTMMYGSLHMENHITFLTDTTGQELSISEYAYYWDTTYTFTYIFHPEVNGVEVYFDGSHIPSYFRYHPDNQTLTQPEAVFYKVEQ